MIIAKTVTFGEVRIVTAVGQVDLGDRKHPGPASLPLFSDQSYRDVSPKVQARGTGSLKD